jgi:hypothetical protein
MSYFSKMSSFVLTCVSAIALLSTGAPNAHARGYTLQILPPVIYEGGPYQFSPASINDAGEIAGVINGWGLPAVRRNGGYSLIPVPQNDRSIPQVTNSVVKINNAGQVIFRSNFFDASSKLIGGAPALYNPSSNTSQLLPTVSGGANTFLYDLNDNGLIVGDTLDTNNQHALTWTNGVLSALPGLPGNLATIAFGVNNAGHAVGWSFSAAGDRMVIWKNGVPTDMGALEYSVSEINDHDQVLGQRSVIGGGHEVRTSIWTQGIWTDIGAIHDADQMFAHKMNNKAWIVGMGANSKTLTWYCFMRTDAALIDINSLLPAGSTYNIQTVDGFNNNDQIVGLGSSDGSFGSSSYLLTPALAAKPSLNAVSPSSIGTAGGSITLTLTGSGFENDTTASVNGGSPLVTKYVSSTQLLATIPHEALNGVSQLNVTVYTPPAGGGTSNSLAVSVTVPTVASITPNRIDLGTVSAKVALIGVNFDPHAVVTINDTYTVTPTVLSSTKLTAILPASVTGNAGSYFVRVVNPGWSNYSAPVRLTIGRMAPVISSPNPDRVPSGLASLSLYVYGTGIVGGSKVSFNNGAPITPTSIQANRLVVSVPVAVLAKLGTYQVRVVNSIADGGASEPKNFVVASRPVLTAITLSAFKASAASVTLTLTGANFEPGSLVKINDTTSVTPTFVSSTKLTIVLPSAVSSTAGSYFARVVNPGYANNSSPMRFTVTSAAK